MSDNSGESHSKEDTQCISDSYSYQLWILYVSVVVSVKFSLYRVHIWRRCIKTRKYMHFDSVSDAHIY